MFERLSRRLVGSVLLWDVALTLVCLYCTSFVRLRLPIGNAVTVSDVTPPWPLYPAATCIWVVVFLLLTPQRALFFSTLIEAIGRLFAAVALASLVFAGLLYLSFRDISRLQFLIFVALDLAVLVGLHLLFRSLAHSRGRVEIERRVLIVGTGNQARQLAEELERRPWTGLRVVGVAGDESLPAGSPPCLGPIATTPAIVAQHQIEEVIFAIPQQDIIADLSLQLQRHPVMLHMVPRVLDLAFVRTPIETLNGIPLISLRESALSESERVLKRLFDMVGSALLLLLCSPVMLVIAIAIKLESSGPVFFLQERIGEEGRRFHMIKFRSMSEDAEQRWREVVRRDAEGNLIHKHDQDPRITRVGRKLRRTSLDELPQLINVLRGDMSLVGPRPEMPYMADEYAPWQWQRFRVPAGMTGWWQVNGRSGKPMHLNTEDDLYYIQNYSFWLDLKILWMTITTVLRGHGAF